MKRARNAGKGMPRRLWWALPLALFALMAPDGACQAPAATPAATKEAKPKPALERKATVKQAARPVVKTPAPTPTPSPEYVAAIRDARRLMGRKQYPEAIEALTKAAKIAPESPEPHCLMARCYDALHQTPDAEREALVAIRKTPADPVAVSLLKSYADRRMSGKKPDYERALKLLEPLQVAVPDDSQIQETLYRIYTALNQYDKVLEVALKRYERIRAKVESGALNLPEKPYGVMTQLALAYSQADRHEEGLKRFTEAAKGGGAGARLDALMPSTLKNERYNALVRDGWALYQRKQIDQALQKFRQAAGVYPDKSDAYLGIATCHERAKNLPEAQQAALKAYQIDGNPKARNFLLNYVRANVQKRKYQEALSLLQSLYKQEPTYRDVLDQLLYCYNNTGAYAKSIEAGEAGLAAHLKEYAEKPDRKPFAPQFVITLAEAYYKTGKLEAIIGQREKTVTEGPTSGVQKIVLERYLSAMGAGLLNDKRAEEAIPYFKRAVDVSAQKGYLIRQVAQAMRRADRTNEAIAYLQEWTRNVPDDPYIREDLAAYLYAAEKYAEAEKLYRELATQRKDSRRYSERILNCLVKQQKWNDAAAIVEEEILRVELSDMPPEAKQQAIARLEERHMNILESSDLLDKRIASLKEQIAADPANAFLRNRLADIHLSQGCGALALSEHLQAAYLAKDVGHLIEQANRLSGARRNSEALTYLNAIIEHFPTNSKVFDVLDRMIQLRTNRDSRRFAFDAGLVEAHRLAETTCKRVLASDAPQDLKREAELRRVKYHYQPMRADPEMWRGARAEMTALLDRPDNPPEFRRSVMNEIADIDLERLNDAESAYRIVETLAREDPDKRNIMRLCDVAERLNPPPEPTLLRQFMEQQRGKSDSVELQYRLGLWLWDMGRREESVKTLRELAVRIPNYASARGQKGFFRDLRRTRPELLKLLDLPQSTLDTSGTLELLRERVWETVAPDIAPGQPLAHYEETRLTLPPELSGDATLRLFAAERPAVVQPPVLLRQVAFSWQSSPAEAQGGLSDPSTIAEHPQVWSAVWRPELLSTHPENDSANITLSSTHEEGVLNDVEARCRLLSVGDDEEGQIFQAYIRMPVPYTVRFQFPPKTTGLRIIEPAIEASIDEDTVRISTEGSDAGTTYTIRFDWPGRIYSKKWLPEGIRPSVDIFADAAERSDDMSHSGRTWTLDDSKNGLRLELETTAEAANIQRLTAKRTERTVYRIRSTEIER